MSLFQMMARGPNPASSLFLSIKFYWGAAMFIHLHTDSAFGCFCAERESWVAAAETAWPTKPNIFAFCSLQRSLQTHITPSCNVHVIALTVQVNILEFRESRQLAHPTSEVQEPTKHWGPDDSRTPSFPWRLHSHHFPLHQLRGVLWHVVNRMVFSARHC